MTLRSYDCGQKIYRERDGMSLQFFKSFTRNLFIIGLLFTVLVIQRTTSMPSRLTKGSTDEDSFVFPRHENPRRSIGYQEKTAKRETPRRGNDADSTGDIVFPNDEGGLLRPSQSFTPGPPPECKTKTYCEKTAFYPENYLSTVIREHDDLKMLEVVDAVDYIAQRIDVDDSTPLCTAEEQLVYPTAAQNRANNWLFVVNQEGFRQGVRVETCQTDEGECAVISGWAFGYRSICKQKYILRQLTAISPNGTVIRDMFRLPSSCCCQVKLEASYNSRIGISQSPDDQTTSPTAKRRKRTLK